MTVEQIKNFNFNTAIISTCGIDNEYFSTEKTLEQALVKKEVLKRAKTKILLIDSSKFSSFGTHKVVSLDNYDFIVTDKRPSDEIMQYLSNLKTKILYRIY